MKMQFSEGGVRVRIAREAFDRLRDGARLRLDLPLGADGFAVVLQAGPGFDARTDSGSVSITLPAQALTDLAGRLPARDGLEFAATLGGRSVAIVLEVDVRPARPSGPAGGPMR